MHTQKKLCEQVHCKLDKPVFQAYEGEEFNIWWCNCGDWKPVTAGPLENLYIYIYIYIKGKAIPLQTWYGPEGG